MDDGFYKRFWRRLWYSGVIILFIYVFTLSFFSTSEWHYFATYLGLEIETIKFFAIFLALYVLVTGLKYFLSPTLMLAQAPFHVQDKDRDFESIVSRLSESSDFDDDEQVKQISNELKENLSLVSLYRQLTRYFVTIEDHLSAYIEQLSRNSIINLLIGLVSTILALGILVYVVFEGETLDFDNTTEILGHYLPRALISVFIQIFAFFFLKLYRNNLADVKFFQNERTSIKSRIAAFKIAYLMKNEDAMNKLLDELTTIERNVVIKKGETTVDIEKSRIAAGQDSQYLDLLTKVFHKNSGNN